MVFFSLISAIFSEIFYDLRDSVPSIFADLVKIEFTSLSLRILIGIGYFVE